MQQLAHASNICIVSDSHFWYTIKWCSYTTKDSTGLHQQQCLPIPHFHSTIFCIKVHIIRSVCVSWTLPLFNSLTLSTTVSIYRFRCSISYGMIFSIHVSIGRMCVCVCIYKMFPCSHLNGFATLEHIPWLLWLYQHISLLKHDFNYTDHETWISLTFFFDLSQRHTMYLNRY